MPKYNYCLPSQTQMLPPSLHALEPTVKELEPRAWLDESESRIEMPCEAAGEPATLFVSLANSILHLQIFLALRVSPSAADRAARAICQINERLPLPGFGFLSESGFIYYRASLPVPQTGIEKPIFTAVLNTCIGTADDYFGELVMATTPPQVPRPSHSTSPDNYPAPNRYRRNEAYLNRED